MTAKIIKTERLLMRPITLADAADCARLIGDIEVSRWLTVVPYPYSIEDALDFIENSNPEYRFAVVVEDRFAGIVGSNGELGFWLGKPYWRNGLMKEAVGAAVVCWFDGGGGDLTSGYFTDNAGSKRILEGLGFLPTQLEATVCKATGREAPLQKVELGQGDWQLRHA